MKSCIARWNPSDLLCKSMLGWNLLRRWNQIRLLYPREAGFHRKAISSTEGGFLPPEADLTEKALALASAFFMVRATGLWTSSLREGQVALAMWILAVLWQLAQVLRYRLPVPKSKGVAMRLLFDFGTGNRTWTCTQKNRILNPTRLPIPPCPQNGCLSKHRIGNKKRNELNTRGVQLVLSWRRRWDSNPRAILLATRFRVRSVTWKLSNNATSIPPYFSSCFTTHKCFRYCEFSPWILEREFNTLALL